MKLILLLQTFVADLRAPTPTAAAELVTEYYFQLNDRTGRMESKS
jgi:exonuclease VII large subunit